MYSFEILNMRTKKQEDITMLSSNYTMFEEGRMVTGISAKAIQTTISRLKAKALKKRDVVRILEDLAVRIETKHKKKIASIVKLAQKNKINASQAIYLLKGLIPINFDI